MAWPLAGGKLVYGWPASEGLQKVRITAVPDFVSLDQISAHMYSFGHVLKIERGRDRLFPSAFDGVVHLNIQLRQGSILPNFLAIREEGRTLLNVAYVFSDLHKKVCFRCGQLAHLGQHCRAAVKAITEQGPAWSFMDVPARDEEIELGVAGVGRQETGGQLAAPALAPQPVGAGGVGQGVGLAPVTEDGGCLESGGSPGERVLVTPVDPAGGEAGLVRELRPPFRAVAVLGTAESGGEPLLGVSEDPLPPGQGAGKQKFSADPSIGRARVVKGEDSLAGPPFRVVSAPETLEAEASSVALSPPSEPLVYLSPDASSLGAPFPGVTSQDTMSSPCLSDSALRVASEQGSQLSLPSEAEAASGLESDGADSTQAELPLGQFQVVKGARQKRKKPEAERLAAGSSLKPADAKRMVAGRLASSDRQSLEIFRDSLPSP